MTRQWTNILEHEQEIQKMRRQGKTRKEIAEALDLTIVQIKNFINRRHRGQKNDAIPKRRGRKPAITLQEYKYEAKRLKMENELLRSFLHVAGRM